MTDSEMLFKLIEDDPIEILRITKEGVWANPDIPVDEAAKKVLEAIDHNIKVLVQKAVEEEREKIAQWMSERGYATGHGDTVEDLLKELEWQAAERERKECANVAESYEPTCDTCPSGVANAIRARGEK
jgi:hypothetical protein